MAEENPHELVGWAVMHRYFRIDRSRWRVTQEGERRAAIAEFSES